MSKPKILEMQGTTLYENKDGTTDTIQLNDSIRNYIGGRLKIYGISSNNNESCFTECLILSNSVVVPITTTYFYNTNDRQIQEGFAVLEITDNNLEFKQNSYYNIMNGQVNYVGNPNGTIIKITKVVAYKN